MRSAILYKVLAALMVLMAAALVLSFAVLGANLRFVGVMVAGSIAGALLGGLLLGVSRTWCSSRSWPPSC